MDNRQLFERHRKRLEKEAWLKSVLLSLVIGFAAMLATAVLTWVFEKNGIVVLSFGSRRCDGRTHAVVFISNASVPTTGKSRAV